MTKLFILIFITICTQASVAEALKFVDFDKVQMSSEPKVTNLLPYVMIDSDLQEYTRLHSVTDQSFASSFNSKDDLVSKDFSYNVKARVKVNNENIIFLQSLGTESGGGSGSIYIDSNYRLIDFYNLPNKINPIFQDKSISKEFSTSFNQLEDIIKSTFKLIEDWEDLSEKTILPTIFTPIFTGSLNVLKFIPVDSIDEELNHFVPSIDINKSNIVNMANYSRSKKGFKPVLINKKIMQSPKIDQYGIILHEVVRHIQFTIGSKFNDEILQKITALLLVCEPELNLSYYTMALISNGVELAKQRYGTYSEVIGRWCVNKYK